MSKSNKDPNRFKALETNHQYSEFSQTMKMMQKQIEQQHLMIDQMKQGLVGGSNLYGMGEANKRAREREDAIDNELRNLREERRELMKLKQDMIDREREDEIYEEGLRKMQQMEQEMMRAIIDNEKNHLDNTPLFISKLGDRIPKSQRSSIVVKRSRKKNKKGKKKKKKKEVEPVEEESSDAGSEEGEEEPVAPPSKKKGKKGKGKDKKKADKEVKKPPTVKKKAKKKEKKPKAPEPAPEPEVTPPPEEPKPEAKKEKTEPK